MIKLLLTLLLLSTHLFANELKNNTSPYLKLHGDDPVNWRLLDKNLLKEAQENNKLVYISSGYFSCHWCHVMQHESYKNEEVAAFLNKHVISIKIDRELEPALDTYLIDFVQKTRGSAGWPLNVFITPEGYPLLGLTYLPKDQFLDLVKKLQSRWKKDSEQFKKLAKKADKESLDQVLITPLKKSALKDKFTQEIYKYMDDFEGGFGGTTKFPMVPNLMLLLELAKEPKNKELKLFLKTTLDKMMHSGLRDPLNGGFFRYTVNPSWETPHFEKMLYTNALLISLYLKADLMFPHNNYKVVALDTIKFVNRYMKHENGGYISSWTADDNQQVEGGYYLWQDSELKDILTTREYKFIKDYWFWNTLEETGEDLSYPIQKQSLLKYALKNERPYRTLVSLLAKIKVTLSNYQEKNHTNPLDDKRITSWNALMLDVLLQAKLSTQATELKTWIDTTLYKNNELYRNANHNTLATLEDYAFLSKALLNNKNNAQNIIIKAWDTFFDKGLWHASQHTFLPGESGYYQSKDGALPSAEAILINSTQKLLNKKPNKKLETYLNKIKNTQIEGFQKSIFWYPTYLLEK